MSVYTPFAFRDVDDRAAIARLMHDHPFATLVTPVAPRAADLARCRCCSCPVASRTAR